MSSGGKRFLIIFENILKEKNASALISIFFAILSLPSSDRDKKLERLSALVGHFPMLLKIKYLRLLIKRLATKNGELKSLSLSNSIVIKPFISPKEKGIILISFERELEKVCTIDLLKEIEKRFYIVFIPSWSGMFSPALFSLAAMASQVFFIMPVHKKEHQYAKFLGEHCIALSFNAANWVNHEFFEDGSVPRDIDCLIVANFAKFKRHWMLFEAVSKVSRDLKVYCVGVPWGGRGKLEIEEEAQLFGVLDAVTVIESPEQEDLRNYFRRAKYFCAMSYREGSFIAVAESLIAGTPVIMFKNSFIGTKSLLNKDNGILLSSSRDLVSLLENLEYGFDNDRIRAEAIREFSAFASCKKLNKKLMNHILKEENSSWTSNIKDFYSVRLSFLHCDLELKGDKEFHKLEFNDFSINI